MFYIVTYATHSEKYFNLLKSYPNLVILGYGEKWTGLHNKVEGVLSFCKEIKSDDIVCFIDAFDTLVLESSSEILKRYKEINRDLIFSKGANSSSVFVKYTQDKLFGNCNNQRLNTGMYIGRSQSIINIWKGFKKNMDDQYFITQRCINGEDIYIDKNCYLFYNYCPNDKIKIKKGEIYDNNNKFNSCIISSPGNTDIKDILVKLNYKNVPNISKKFLSTYRFKTYFNKFISEIIFLVILIVFILIGYKNLITYLITIILLSCFLEFNLKTKFLKISSKKKLLYTVIDFCHISISLLILYLTLILLIDILKLKCNINLFLFVNLTFLIVLLLFFIFKRCIITLWTDKLTNTLSSWKDVLSRLKYLFNKEDMYFIKEGKSKKNFTYLWMNGNIHTVSFLIVCNVYFLIMFIKKKCK